MSEVLAQLEKKSGGSGNPDGVFTTAYLNSGGSLFYTFIFSSLSIPSENAQSYNVSFGNSQTIENSYLKATRTGGSHSITFILKKKCMGWVASSTQPTYYNAGTTVTISNAYSNKPAFVFFE